MKSQGCLNKRKIKGASKRDTLRGAGIWRTAHLSFCWQPGYNLAACSSTI